MAIGVIGLHASNPTYNDGDLMIGFRSLAAGYTANNYLIDVGPVANYRDASGPITVGNFGDDLKGGLALGSNWYSSFLWGAIAGIYIDDISTGSTTDISSTLYASKAVSSIGDAATPWIRDAASAQGSGVANAVSSMGSDFAQFYQATANSSNAVVLPSGNVNSWSFWDPSANSALAFKGIPGSIEAGPGGSGGSVLNLFRIEPSSDPDMPSVSIGYFSIDASGTILFTPSAGGTSGGGGSYAGPWNWTNGSGNWGVTNNWTSNQVASNGYAVGITGSGGTITNNAVTNISSMTFSNGAGAYTLTGTNASQTLTITGGITNNSSATQTISLGLNTTSNQTINAASGNITLSAVSNTAALTLQEGSGKSITAGGQISGNGSLVQNGSGTLSLATSNSYTGGTTLNGGTVVAGNSASLGSGNISVASNAMIAAGTSITLSNALGVSSGATATLNNAGYTWVQNGAIGGQGGIALNGAGTTTLGASNSYQGGTTINGGTVVAVNNNSFGSGSISVASSSTIAAGTPTLNTTNAMAVASGQIATLNTDSNNWTQTGVIGGGGGVGKAGNGTLTVSGVNNYTGPTLVSGGTLQVTGSLLGAGTVTVASGGTLSGTGYVGKTTIQSGGAITAGANANVGSLSLSSLILNGGGSWNWKMLDATGSAGVGFDTLGISGLLDISTLSSANKFTINLQTLSGTNPAVSGNALNFEANVSTNWVIASYGNLAGTFSTNLFKINSSGFSNSLSGGTFGIGTNASGLILSYTTAFVAGAAGEWNSGSGNLSTKTQLTNGVSLLFSGAGGSVTNNSAVISLSGITFATNAGTYTLSGNAITNGGSGIVNNSTNAQVISNAITLGSVQTFTAGGGSLTFEGNIGLLSNTLTVSGSNNTTLSGEVSGTAGIIKAGSGTLILSGADNFTGGVTISAGSLLLSGGDNRLWTNSSVSVAEGSSLNLGTNSQQLASLSGNGTLTGQSSATLTLAPSNASSFAGTITGGEAVAVTGSGTMTLSGSNSYTGGTTVSGNLVASNASALGASTNSLAVTGSLNLGSQTITQGQVTLSGGTITGGTLSATNVRLQGGTISANLGGSAAVTQTSGTTTLSGSNSFTGGVSVNGGTLLASNAYALAGGDVSVNAGTLNLSSVSESVGAVTLGNGTVTGSGILTQKSFTATNSGQALVSESLSGTGGLTQIGAGTTTLAGSNSFIGGVTLSAGKLIASNAFALGSTNGSVNIAGATLDLGGLAQRIGSTTLTSGSIGNGTLTASSGVTVTGNSNSTISATLAGSGGLSKSGSGTLNLASALPSGSVRITGGTMQSSASVIGSATNAPAGVTVSSNAVWTNSGQLTVGGSGSGSLTIGSGGTVAASGLLIASNATSRGTVTLGDSNGVSSLALGNGSITFGAGTGNLIFNQRGALTVSNSISSLTSGKGTITSSGSGTTILTANNSGFTGSTYLSSGAVVLGTNSQLGGAVNIANKSAVAELRAGSSLSSTNAVHAVAGTLTDNSGSAFKDSIRGQVVLAEGGTLNKTYSNTSVAGFSAGIGAGKSFSLLAGSVAGSATLTAKVTAGALDFKGTYSNAIVMSITDPSFSTIRNTIQWYDPVSKSWKNTVVGNTGNKTARIDGMNGKSFAGSFSTFLLQAKTAGILTAAEDTLAEINAMTATQINTTLAKIMGAFGYDNSTKTSWAVINHNSLYSGDDLGSSSIFDEAALNHTLSDPGFAPLDPGTSVATVQAVPEPGTWAMMMLGAGAVILGGWRRKAEKLKLS
jgi:autotransporter-associated beta strand protein